MGKHKSQSPLFCFEYSPYKFLGKEVLIKRSELVKARVPKNSYCKYINGNILSVYPAFIKTEQQWQDEINQLLSNAEQVI